MNHRNQTGGILLHRSNHTYKFYTLIYVDNHKHGDGGEIHGYISQTERSRHYNFCTLYPTH